MLDAGLSELPALIRWYLLNEWLLLPLVSFVLFLGCWELGGRLGLLDTFFFSSPPLIIAAGANEVLLPRFWNDVAVSSTEFMVGYLGAVIIAIPFGLITGWYRPLHYFFDPWLNAFNATPRIALLPLIVLWLGLGIWSKIAVIYLGVFFPLAINTFHGVRTVDRNLMDVTTSFGASSALRFQTLILPSVVPFVLVGLRIGVGRAIVGVLVGEFYSADAGLGKMIFKAGQTLQTDRLLFGALLITVWRCSRFGRWRSSSGGSSSGALA